MLAMSVMSSFVSDVYLQCFIWVIILTLAQYKSVYVKYPQLSDHNKVFLENIIIFSSVE